MLSAQVPWPAAVPAPGASSDGESGLRTCDSRMLRGRFQGAKAGKRKNGDYARSGPIRPQERAKPHIIRYLLARDRQREQEITGAYQGLIGALSGPKPGLL